MTRTRNTLTFTQRTALAKVVRGMVTRGRACPPLEALALTAQERLGFHITIGNVRSVLRALGLCIRQPRVRVERGPITLTKEDVARLTRALRKYQTVVVRKQPGKRLYTSTMRGHMAHAQAMIKNRVWVKAPHGRNGVAAAASEAAG